MAAPEETVRTYRLSPEAVAKLRDRSTAYMAVLMILGLAFIFLQLRAWTPTMVPAAFVMLFFCAIVLLVMRQTMTEEWSSYELTVGSDFVLRKKIRAADVEIRREEVVAVEERPGKGLTIRTKNRYRVIFVPEGLEGYEELKPYLRQWKGIGSATAQRTSQLVAAGAVVLGLVLHFGRVWLPEGRWRTAAEVAALASILWAAIEQRKNPQMFGRSRRFRWLLYWVSVFIAAVFLLMFLQKFLKG